VLLVACPAAVVASAPGPEAVPLAVVAALPLGVLVASFFPSSSGM